MSYVIDFSNIAYTSRDIGEICTTTGCTSVFKLDVALLETRPQIEDERAAFWVEQTTLEDDDRIYEIFRDFLILQLAEQGVTIDEVIAYVACTAASDLSTVILESTLAVESSAKKYIAEDYVDGSGRYWFDIS